MHRILELIYLQIVFKSKLIFLSIFHVYVYFEAYYVCYAFWRLFYVLSAGHFNKGQTLYYLYSDNKGTQELLT